MYTTRDHEARQLVAREAAELYIQVQPLARLEILQVDLIKIFTERNCRRIDRVVQKTFSHCRKFRPSGNLHSGPRSEDSGLTMNLKVL